MRIYPDAGFATTAPGNVRFTIDDSKRLMTEMIWTLTTRWKITKANGTAIVAENVAPIAGIHYTMWNDCCIKVGNTFVAGNDLMFAYKTYLETCLGYSSEAKNTWLGSMIAYYEDTYGQFEDLTDDNKGFTKCKEMTAASAICETRSKLPLDISQANRYLIAGIPMVICLSHAPDSFRLMTDVADLNPKLEIVSIYLTLRRVMVSASIFLAVEQNLNSGLKAVYPMKRTLLITQQLAIGLTNFTTTLFLGQKPAFIFIGFVRSDGFNGTYALNPFRFIPVNTNFAQINFEGRFYPQTAYQPGYGEKIFHLQPMFEEFHRLCGTLYSNTGNGVDKELFNNGLTLFSFNLSETEPNSILREPYREGRTRAEFKFSAALNMHYNLIAMGIFNNEMSISSERVVSINYALGSEA